MGNGTTPTHNTLISLREYVDIRFDAQDKAVNAALAAAERAVTKAEIASEKRFDSVNEFRAALADSARLLMPRSEYEVNHKGLVERIDRVSTKLETQDARRFGMSQSWLILVAGLSFLSTVVVVIYYLTNLHR